VRITIRPFSDPERELDITRRLVGAIAEELWRHRGGNDVLNWLEAERQLRLVMAAGSEPAGSGGEKRRSVGRRGTRGTRARRPRPKD
jgi:hypothetical protein